MTIDQATRFAATLNDWALSDSYPRRGPFDDIRDPIVNPRQESLLGLLRIHREEIIAAVIKEAYCP